VLPGPVVLERLALERPDPHVVQLALDLERNRSAPFERDSGSLLRA
jgi:hypothetical protein